MNKSHIKRGSVRLVAVRRGVLLALVLTVVIGGVTPSAPAQAAPLRDETEATYEIAVAPPTEPICVGDEPVVTVRLIKNVRVKRRGVWGPPREEAPGIETIKGRSTDRDVGTLTPPSMVTGWDLDGDSPGRVSFVFHAKKAGDTELRFHAVPGGKYISVNQPIKVVNCSYKVGMNVLDVYSGGGVTIWASGSLDLIIEGEGGEMTGTGDLEFVSGFVGPPCSITYSEFANATTITGQVNDNDQLTLEFDFQPGTVTSNISCPDGSDSGSQEVDMTNTGITDATFPATGGTRSFRFTYAGSDMGPGTMIITVEPVSEEDGGLSS